ncbi:MAG TPA: hypothetical protein VGL97_23440 [Bryobacteraceae bacterium]
MSRRTGLCGILLLAVAAGAQVTTSQYDNARTGADVHETILNPRNVNATQFGKLFRFSVDGDVYAQPLYLPSLPIPGKGTHDVVFVATERDSVYAFDAAGNPAAPLWKVNFTDRARGITTLSQQNASCPFIAPALGITSTPVIDRDSGTLYVLVRTKEGDRFWQRLHALDVRTGREKSSGPVVIAGSVENKTGGFLGLLSGTVSFLALHENPRAALLLDHGRLYLTWASSCDVGPYHGWVIAYDARTLKQIGIFNTSPDAGLSGIWQSDTGPAADEDGNVFVATGNGVFDAASGGRDYGDSVLKLGWTAAGLFVRDYFTPFDQAALNRTDGDLGSGGPLVIPTQPGSSARLLAVAGKGAELYLINRDHMGRFHAENNRHAVQTIGLGGGLFGAPAYWNGHLYCVASDDALKDFAIKGGRLSDQPVAQSRARFLHPGAIPSISANGTTDAIVWLIEVSSGHSSDTPAVLRAYDAANVTNELYNSATNSERDRAAAALHFTIPMVADGRVYLPASGEVDVYGLLPHLRE